MGKCVLFNGRNGPGISMNLAVRVFQFTIGFGVFYELAGLSISVDWVYYGAAMDFVVWSVSVDDHGNFSGLGDNM